MIYRIYTFTLLVISLISVSGAFVYKIFELSSFGVILSLFLASLVFFIILFLHKKLNEKGILIQQSSTILISDFRSSSLKIEAKTLPYLLIYFLLLVFGFFILLQSRSSLSLISPWEAVPKYFFFVYFLTLVFLYLNVKKNAQIAIFLLIFNYIFTLSIALIVYKLGFGYDPFIHTATMEYIDKHGQALPKPFYYLGYYALIIITHKLTLIPISFLSKSIVPILTGLLLPPTIYLAGRKWFDNKKNMLLTLVFLLVLPFGIFIISTPQNLAYLFLVILLFYGIFAATFFDYIVILLLGLAALSFQPITGIPAFLLAIGLLLFKNSKFIRKKSYLFVLLLSNALILPLIFYFINFKNSSNGVVFLKVINQSALSSFFRISWSGKEDVISNLLYFIIFNYKFLWLTLIAVGLIIIFKYKKDCQLLILYSFFSLSLLVSWTLTRLLAFDFLITYEQDDFSNRILINAGIFLVPMFFIVGHALITKIKTFTPALKNIYLTSLALLILISLYQSYPRFDAYFNSHGYSVSQKDIEAVNWIKQNAKNDYIVLANQQVSAAALKEFGFNKYYKPNQLFLLENKIDLDPETDIFYYPVPTGGPLYPYYLKMVDEKPSRSTILEAMDLTGVSEGYFVLNKYWWAFTKILDEAKVGADAFQIFGNNEVVVFKYKK